MSEAKFYARCRVAWAIAMDNRVFIQRIENLVDSGVPDVWLSKGGQSAWIELKWLPAGLNKPRIGAMQYAWAHKAMPKGVQVRLVVGLDREHAFSQGGRFVAWYHDDLPHVARELAAGVKLPQIEGGVWAEKLEDTVRLLW